MKRGLFVGRFQPPHLGHLEAIKEILNNVDELVIVVAAAQYSYTMLNPFTAGERIEMLRLTLGELYDKCYIIPVDDIPSNFLWPQHVLNYVPRVSVVYTLNPLVKLLFEEQGLEVRGHKFVKGISGTLIRTLIARNNDKWESMVSKEVAEYIREIRGVERIKFLYEHEIRIPGEKQC